MEWLIDDIERNSSASTPGEALARPVPEFQVSPERKFSTGRAEGPMLLWVTGTTWPGDLRHCPDRDAVLLVGYPSREAFSRMVADPARQKVTQLCTQALTEAVLQPTSSW
jgi:hypothetical protein